MSTLKRLFSCLGSQGREGHFQGGIHLAHRRIAPLGYNAITWHYLTISNSSYQFGTGAFLILINIFDTYILAADTYCCLSHWVAPSLMAQSGDLPAPAAESGLGSTAGLQLRGAQTRQPAAKPHPHRLLQHYNWCYSEEQSNSYGNIPCV